MTNYKPYINALRQCAKEHENDITPFAHIRVSDLCKDTANLLEELEQEPRWIPTSERYPSPDNEYKLFLVTDDKGKVSVQEFYLSLDEEPQPYFSGMTNVVAWMPLPKPYKGESEE